MSDMFKTMVERIVQVGVGGLATWLVSNGWLNADQQQGFIGAAFFLAIWLYDTFVTRRREKKMAALEGGIKVADAATDSFSPDDVKRIVKGK